MHPLCLGKFHASKGQVFVIQYTMTTNKVITDTVSF